MSAQGGYMCLGLVYNATATCTSRCPTMTNTPDKIEADKWKHRRRLAYASMAGLLIMLGKTLWDPTGAMLAGALLENLGYALAAIVMAYMGLATFEHFGKK